MAIIRFFSKLFNIRYYEWPRLLLIYLILFIIVASSTWGKTIVEAAFLQHVGVQFLPWVFIVNAIFSIVAIAVYTAFADRVANDKLLIVVLIVCEASVIVGLMTLNWGLVAVAYPLLYLTYFVVLVDVFNLHWATYVNGFYDTQAAKRIVPVVSSSGRTAGIVGGLTMPLLNSLLAPSNIIVLWLAALMAATLLIWLMPRILKEDKTSRGTSGYVSVSTSSGADKQPASYLDNIREGYRFVSQSSFLRWMAVSTLISVVLLGLLYYRASQILVAEFQTTQAISNFVGFMSGVANLAMLPILFLLSRIIGRIGLGNSNLIFPTGTLAISGSLAFLPGIPTAALAYLDRTAFYRTLSATINTLLYNAVPIRIKGRTRAFIGGFITPVGSLIGGGLLLLLPFISAGWVLSGLIVVLAVAFLGSALAIRTHYAQALIQMLEQEDFSFLLSQEASDVIVADQATLTRLQKRLQESASHEFTVFIAQLISQVGGRDAISILEPAARSTKEPRTRSAIVDVLVAADLRGDRVRRLYVDFLADSHAQVRQSAIAGLEQLAGPGDEEFLSYMLGMVQDPDMDVRIRALTALVHSANFFDLTPAAQMLDQLLEDKDPHHRAYGVRVLGQAVLRTSGRDEQATRRLAGYLADPADQVRLEAAVAVEALAQGTLSDQLKALMLEEMRPLLEDPIERVRQAALVVLGCIGTRELHQAVVSALADPSPQIRAAAVDALVQAGNSIVPILHPKLDSSDPQLRKMAAVTLSRLNPREFSGLIVGSNITGNLLAIYRHYGLIQALSSCTGYRSLAILQSALRERSHQLADEIFYLLTAIHDPHAVSVIEETLYSDSPRDRANATEALEALTTPHLAGLIAPLFEPDVPPAKLLSLSEDTWDMDHPDTTGAIRALAIQPDDPWLRAITAFALGEIGASLSPGPVLSEAEGPVPQGTSGPPTARKARRSPLADLLGENLNDTSTEESNAQSERPRQKKRRERRSPPTDLLGMLIETSEDAPGPSEKREALDSSSSLLPEKSDQPCEDCSSDETERPGEKEQPPSPPCPQIELILSEIEIMLATALTDQADEVRVAAQAARRVMAAGGLQASFQVASVAQKEENLLSTIERVIFLKEVPFFQGMTVDQLKVLATVCEEEFFEGDTRIFSEGDPGGALYVVVSGRVGIDQEKRKGSFARLATIEAHSYFGETSLFDNNPRSAAAIALQDTLTLRLRREPLIALARQYPDLSLELINVLSKRLREANARVADLTRSRPRALQKLYDKFD
jgi:HEAT repeat protein